ncbi:hypothetical protein ACOWOG_07465, partial [Helicobacter pylori]
GRTEEIAIVSSNGEPLKVWNNFEVAINEIEKLGNVRIEGDFWVSEMVRVSGRVLKGLYNELVGDNWEQKIIRECKRLEIKSATIHALGEYSVLKDRALIKGLKGWKHFGISAASFSDLFFKLEKMDLAGGVA